MRLQQHWKQRCRTPGRGGVPNARPTIIRCLAWNFSALGFCDKLGSFHLEPAAWWWNGLKGIGAIGNASQKSLTRLIERRGFQGNSDVSSAKWNDAELTEVMHTAEVRVKFTYYKCVTPTAARVVG